MFPVSEAHGLNDMSTFDMRVDAVQGWLRAEASPHSDDSNAIEGVVSRISYEGDYIRFFVIPYGEDKETDGPIISSDFCTWWSQTYLPGEPVEIGCVIIDDHLGSRSITIHGVRLRPKHREVTDA